MKGYKRGSAKWKRQKETQWQQAHPIGNGSPRTLARSMNVKYSNKPGRKYLRADRGL